MNLILVIDFIFTELSNERLLTYKINENVLLRCAPVTLSCCDMSSNTKTQITDKEDDII